VKLVHYSAAPIGALVVREQKSHSIKPTGLWVSDDDDEQNWRAWCEAEDVRPDCLRFAYDVELVPDANVLFLRSAPEVLSFGREWLTDDPALREVNRSEMFLAWNRVRERWAGLMITPYQWEVRLGPMWYYGWDCASGCIWDPAAIKSITLRET